MIYGSSGPVVEEIAREVPVSARIVWLTGEPVAPPAWQGTRQLIAFAADVLARGAFDALLARHRPAVAALYPERAIELSGDERSAVLHADPRSLHTHSMASWQPLLQAVAALVADALEATGATVAVPELARLDAATSHALVEVFRCHGERLAGLRLGHDLAWATEPILVWGVPVTCSIAQVRRQLANYQLAPLVEVVQVVGTDEAVVPSGPVNDWSGPTPDAIALGMLDEAAPRSPAALAACVRAQRWASEVYAFGAAFRIGALLEPQRAQLDRAAQAEHAALTAVAATNTCFVDTATPGFDEPLYAMYELAIELATDPIAVAALAVRLAFARVDRAAPEVERYLARASASVGVLADALWAQYYGAWLEIARALHELHRRDLAAVDRAAREACAGLDAAVAAATAAWPPPQSERFAREAAYARFLVLSHGAAYAADKDDARAARWLAHAERESARGAAFALYEVFHWVLIRQREVDWQVLHARCLAGIRDAERDWQAANACIYRAVAADCAYRCGRVAEAVTHYRRLLALDVPGNPAVAWVGDIRARALRAFLRAGDGAACAALGARLVAEPAPVEIRGLVARALAAQGDQAGAIAAVERAIDEAVDEGAHVTMLRVALIAAQVMSALDDRAELSRALDTAWELATDSSGAWSEVASPADRLHLCVLQAHASGATKDLLARACAELPASLSDAESWWDIAELLDVIAAWQAPGAALPAEIYSELSVVRLSARYRADWQATLAKLAGAE